MHRVYWDEISGDDVIIFSRDTGIAMNMEHDRLVVFEYKSVFPRELWVADVLKVSEIRTAVMRDDEATEWRLFGSTGMTDAVVNAARNAREREKSRQSQGIRLELRSTERPHVFLNLQLNSNLQRAFEAMRQVLEDRNVPRSFHLIDERTKKRLERDRSSSEDASGRDSVQQGLIDRIGISGKVLLMTALLVLLCLPILMFFAEEVTK